MRRFLSQLWVRQVFAILFVAALYEGSQLFAGTIHVASRLLPKVYERFKWVRYYEHHFWQLAFAMLCIGILSRGRFSQWGFTLKNAAVSWRLFWKFCIGCMFVVLALVVVPAFLTHDAGPGLITPTTSTNTVGWLAFEWGFVGISEEVLFRGLIQTVLARYVCGVWQVRSLQIPYAGLLTAILFCLAHVPNWRHPHIAIDQQVIVFSLSLYASVAYYRTRSLLTPVLVHNFNDGLFVTAQTICYRLLHR